MDYLNKIKEEQSNLNASTDTILENIMRLRNEIDEIYKQISHMVKSSNSMIINSKRLLESSGLKLSKNIDEYSLHDIPMLTNELGNKIPYNIREDLLVYVAKFNYRKIEEKNLEAKLDECKKELFDSNQGKDKDYKDELTITQTSEINEENLSEPTMLHEDLVKDVNEALANEDTLEKSNLTLEIDNIIDEGKITNEPIIIESEENNYLDSLLETEDFENNNKITYKIQDGASFSDIVYALYDDRTNWYNLYNYGNNKEKIDKALNGKKLEDHLYDPNILNGITIEMPNFQDLELSNIKNR